MSEPEGGPIENNGAVKQRLIQLEIKAEVREALDAVLPFEIRQLEEQRSKVYRAYGIAFAVILGVIGITSWAEIPSVVRSLIKDPASGQLAAVFIQGQNNANQLASRVDVANGLVNDLNTKIRKLDLEIAEVEKLTSKATSQVNAASSTTVNLQKLQADLDSQLRNSKDLVGQIQHNVAEVEKGVLEIEFLQYAGRNVFPNPYHNRIMNSMNSVLVIAIPDSTERGKFVKDLEAYTAAPPNK